MIVRFQSFGHNHLSFLKYLGVTVWVPNREVDASVTSTAIATTLEVTLREIFCVFTCVGILMTTTLELTSSKVL